MTAPEIPTVGRSRPARIEPEDFRRLIEAMKSPGSRAGSTKPASE